MSPNFVNREEALNLVAERIRKLRHGLEADEKHFLCFYGVSGIGKTTLLDNLQSHYISPQNDCVHPLLTKACEMPDFTVEPCKAAHEPLPCAPADFFADKFDNPQQGYVNLLEEIIDKTSTFIPPTLKEAVSKFSREVTDFRQRVKRYASNNGNGFNTKAEAANITEQFSIVVKGLIEHHKAMLILLDSMEVIHPKVMELIESEILLPFRKERRLLVILSGITAVRWKSCGPALVPYSTWHELMLFHTEDTQEQIDPCLVDIAHRVHALTGGHPAANSHVTLMWQEEEAKSIQPSPWIEHNGKRISKSLAEEIVFKYILRNGDEEIREAFLKMSIVRQFEVSMLSDLLSVDYPPRYISSTGAAFFWELLRRMQGTRLLKKGHDGKSWEIEPAVRRILTRYLQLNYPETYQGLHQIALKKYDQWINSFPVDQHIFAVENLFHRACLTIHDKPKATSKDVSVDLMDAWHKVLSLPGIDKSQLKTILEGDPDLTEMLGDELKELLRVI